MVNRCTGNTFIFFYVKRSINLPMMQKKADGIILKPVLIHLL